MLQISSGGTETTARFCGLFTNWVEPIIRLPCIDMSVSPDAGHKEGTTLNSLKPVGDQCSYHLDFHYILLFQEIINCHMCFLLEKEKVSTWLRAKHHRPTFLYTFSGLYIPCIFKSKNKTKQNSVARQQLILRQERLNIL